MKTRELYLNHAGTSWPKPSVVSQAVRDVMTASPAQWPQAFDEASTTRLPSFLVLAGASRSCSPPVAHLHWQSDSVYAPIASDQPQSQQVVGSTMRCIARYSNSPRMASEWSTFRQSETD